MLLYSQGDHWEPNQILEINEKIEDLARETLKVNLTPYQFEVVDSKEMLDLYVSIGLPVSPYNHWSFGKRFIQEAHMYKKGFSGQALEMITNTNPMVTYLQTANTFTQQVMILCHCAGHNDYFTNNYLFKEWTDPTAIVDYLNFSREYVAKCEEKYGYKLVEETLDACHALQNYGVSKFRKPAKLSAEKEKARLQERAEQEQRSINLIFDATTPKKKEEKEEKEKFVKEPESNLLYWLEKNSLVLKPYQRELVRIVRKLSQYFEPQRQCVVGDTFVMTENGLQQIKNVIKEKGHNKKIMPILSLDNEFQNTSHIFKRLVDKTIVIKTKLGRVIEGTFEHPIQILDKDLIIKFRDLQDLRVGDHAVIKIGYDTGITERDLLLDFQFETDKNKTVECQICHSHMTNISTHICMTHGWEIKKYREVYGAEAPLVSDDILYRRGKDFIIPKKMTPELGRLLGYFISEGSWNGGGISIFNNDKIVIDDICSILDNLEIGYGLETRQGKLNTVLIYNQKVFAFFDYLGLKRTLSYWKEVPWCITQSNKETIKDFIRAIFEGDGCNSKVGSVFYSSRSKKLVSQLQTLLLHLGIVSRIKRYTIDYDYTIEVPHKFNYNLFILSDYREKFMKEIGFISDRKNNFNTSTPKFSNFDNYIPYLKEHLMETRASIGPRAFARKRIKRENIYEIRSKHFMKRQIPLLGKTFETVKEINYDLFNKLELVFDEENFYDEIVSIKIKEKRKYVYDFTIPVNHAFITNGFVSHNTKVTNEGWATFCHFYLMTELEERGMISEGSYLEFLQNHQAVIFQPEFDDKRYSGFNPYYLGSKIFWDIKRICEKPTNEDREWFPDLVDQDWVPTLRDAMINYRDESFIRQFLSPHLIRKLKLFSLLDEKRKDYVVKNIHDELGYKNIREILSNQYQSRTPEIEIVDVNMKGDRILKLKHTSYNGVTLDNTDTIKTLKYLEYLWGYTCLLTSVSDQTGNEVQRFQS